MKAAHHIKQFLKRLVGKKLTQEEKALRLHAKLKANFDKEARTNSYPLVKLKQTYTCVTGAVYYTYENPAELPYSRHIRINKALEVLTHAITVEYKKEFVSRMAGAVKANDMNVVAQLMQDFNARSINPTHEALSEIACMFFVRHDENPYIVSEQADAKQREDMKLDNAMTDFFLQTCQGILDAFQNSPSGKKQ